MAKAPERIWAWRKTEQISADHSRSSHNWISGHIPEPKHDGTDFLAGYIRRDLAPDPALFAELVEALRGAIGALEFSRDYHADLGNEEQAFAQDKLDAALAVLAKIGGGA